MTDVLIPTEPAERLAWARSILRHQASMRMCVSGPELIRIARGIIKEAENGRRTR